MCATSWRLWAWYVAWTVADVATTLYLARAAPHGGELNLLVSALAPHVGFDAAVVVTALVATAALWLAARWRPLTARAAAAVMLSRPVAAVNNMAMIATGLSLVDYVALATGLGPRVAQILTAVTAASLSVVAVARGCPPAPRDSPIPPGAGELGKS